MKLKKLKEQSMVGMFRFPKSIVDIYGQEIKFPDEYYFITRVSPYNERYSGVTYFILGASPQLRYLPNDMSLAKSKCKKAKAQEKKYHEWILKNPSYLDRYFTIGSDPEMFVTDKDNKLIPAFEFLESKDKAQSVVDKRTGMVNKIYWDGFQAEFDTTATGCLQSHCCSILAGLTGLFQAARKYNKGAKLSIQTTFEVSHDQLANAKDEHVAFGCMPSFNAYGMEGMIGEGRTTPVRSAGGHIHFGVGKKEKQVYINMVKALDAIIGVACVSLFAKYDDPRRRTMYGLAGEYRLPKHGLEYRTLSNMWMCHPLITNIVINLARKALLVGERNMLQYWVGVEEEVIEIINTCNVEAARQMLEQNKDFLQLLIQSCYNLPNSGKLIYNVIMNGVENVIEKPEDVIGNWGIESASITTYEKEVRKVLGILADGKKVA